MDGVEYYDPVTKTGAVYVFRPNSPTETQAIKFKGLDAKAKYWLWSEDGSLSPTQEAGDGLMQTGLTLRLAQPLTSEIIFLQDATLGKPADVQEPEAFSLQSVKTTSQLLSTAAELSWEASRNARSYRVTVGETAEFKTALAHEMVTVPSVSLTGLPPSRTLYWKVEAISRGGSRVNSGSSGTFTTPDILAQGVAFASDMQWIRANAGAENRVRRNVNLHGRTIKINGQPMEKALWTHAFNDATPADIVFDVSGKGFALFRASVGLDDLGEKGSVQFQVLVDGQKKMESPVMRPKKVHQLVVDLSGAKEITLRVLNGGDGYSYDHAVWGFARFLKADTKDPFDEPR